MNDPLIQKTFEELKARFNYVEINKEIDEVPWFPRNIKDLELCMHYCVFMKITKNIVGKSLLNVKDEVNKEHVQFKVNINFCTSFYKEKKGSRISKEKG